MAVGSSPLLLTDQDPSPLADVAREKGWDVATSAQALSRAQLADIAVVAVSKAATAAEWAGLQPDAMRVGLEGWHQEVDVVLPSTAHRELMTRMLARARRVWQMRGAAERLKQDLQLTREQMEMLADVGRALSADLELNQLLETILSEARRLASCEAGSLYLVDREHSELVLKYAQNDVLTATHREARLPLTTSSLAGYVAVTGEELNIADAYALPDVAPYHFNRTFDLSTGFRTRSMLVLPMRDHRGRVIGVLQFINCMAGGKTPMRFDQQRVGLLRAVASQAAVAIQKNGLLADISNLFESFVLASVKAIEQRDPSTSGHSFRVAETTIALLEALPVSGLARFRRLKLSAEHLKEVRYAALLHDFGKVGVPERVLLKARKLTSERLTTLRYRIELQKERFRRETAEEELMLVHRGSADALSGIRELRQTLARRLALLDDYWRAIERANEPTILEEGDFKHLHCIRQHPFVELDGSCASLIGDEDLAALSIRRGTLTVEERNEIQRHVDHTREFLAALPWPPELADVPSIAAAHHEKLDGSGYPDGLVGDAIPLASRVMTVCDIFDALTAMDRPYKSAMPLDAALRVLEDEVRRGQLDGDIVQVFIDSHSYAPTGTMMAHTAFTSLAEAR
jgi:HD-GYP domain-containing protein (c-di-GMP phosphodiesterase class II)